MECSFLALTHRITVELRRSLLIYGNPEERLYPERLKLAVLGLTGQYSAMLDEDGWLTIPGKGGLPYRRAHGLLSIEDAWDQKFIMIERRLPDGTLRRLDSLE